VAKKAPKKKPAKEDKPKEAEAPEAKALTPKQLVASLNRRFDDKAATLMDESEAGTQDVFSTGLAVLDRHVIGIGGLPWGRIIEVSGREGGGKSTLAAKFMAGAQKDGGVAVLLDAERTFEPSWARLHGVDIESLVWVRPDHMFQDGEGGALERVEAIAQRQRKAFIVLDSVSALKTHAEVDGGISADQGVAEIARHWSRGLRILTEILAKSQSTLMLINQVRSTIGGYGPSTDTSGGNAIKFYTSLRLKVWPYRPKDATEPYARIGVEAIKNKLARPWRKADLRLNFDEGFDERWNVLNHAKEVKAVPPRCQSFKEAAAKLGWFDIATETTDDEGPTDAPEEAQEAGDDEAPSE